MKIKISTVIAISLSCSALASTNNTDQLPVHVSGDTTNGYGKVTWPNGHPDGMTAGTAYEGYFKNELPDGYGKLLIPDNELTFFGEFKEGKQSGFGIALTTDNKVLYAGELADYMPAGKSVVISEEEGITILTSEDEPQLTLLPSGKLKRYDIHRIHPTIDTNYVTGILIPNNLEECFVELEKSLTPEFIGEIRQGTEEDISQFHHGLGTFLRNNWGLWKGSELSKWFNEKGIHHPDDMSGIIFDSFWRHLNDKPINFEEQVKFYQGYWERVKKEESNQNPQPTVKTPLESDNTQGTETEL